MGIEPTLMAPETIALSTELQMPVYYKPMNGKMQLQNVFAASGVIFKLNVKNLYQCGFKSRFLRQKWCQMVSKIKILLFKWFFDTMNW